MIRLNRLRRRSALVAGFSVLLGTTAHAQSTTVELPDINVTATRLDVKPSPKPAPASRIEGAPSGRSGPAAARRDGSPAPGAAGPPTGDGDGASTTSAAGPVTLGITGASTSVITAEEIARSPEQTLPGILSREPGVQVSNLFGGVNGARSTVDVRGFGATGASNTLILVNGRRFDQPDLQGFDWGSIPLNSIERVEITRGSSGGVLYGDGAVGGVINIVTKTGVNAPPSARFEAAFGSFNQVEGRASAAASSGPHSIALFGNAIRSDGYRENNRYHQMNAVADYRFMKEWGSVYLNVTGSDQHLGFPAGRRVDPWNNVNQLVTDRRGTDTPYDYGNQQQGSATAGVTFNLLPGAELIVDGGVRARNQQSGFFQSCFDFFNNVSVPNCPQIPQQYFESALLTSSVTPRLRTDLNLFGLPWKALSGIDYYRSDYESPRSLLYGVDPIHRYDLTQTSLAAYAMNTITVFSNTDVSVGGRVQRNTLSARDRLDTSAPGFIAPSCFPFFGCFPGDTQAIPLDDAQTNQAFHLGFEHRFAPFLTLFGRTAQSFRVPNVDERVGSSPFGVPSNFQLKTQKSRDLEGGVRLSVGPMWVQWSVYDMYLTDEIFYSPATFTNINLDPTRRYGSEAIGRFRLSDTVQLKAGVAYTRAVFREGVFAGNDIPLVARNTASVGVVWNVFDTRLVFTGDVRFIGSRRMDNDSRNLQPLTPTYTLVDVRLGGDIDRYFWSVAVQNLFNADYFDYAIASAGTDAFNIGVFNAYPQPGRTFLLRAGVKL